MIAYEADWVCPATSEPVQRGVLLVENGHIQSVTTESVHPDLKSRQYPGCAIIPGFVNTHTHLELSLFHGLLHKLSFADWISELVRIKYSRCSHDALKMSAQLGAMEMLKAGVTCVGEVMDAGTGWDAMLEYGLQGIAYQEVFGPDEAVAAEALNGLRGKVESQRLRESATQRIGVSPHAPYTVSKSLYEGVREYVRGEGLRMTAHIAESLDETQFVRGGTGPFAERHAKRNIRVVPRRCSPVAYLDSLGLLGEDMLLVHAIEADAEDIQRIRETRSFVAHCPKSNMFFGHGVARVAEMREKGVTVSLGTDSTASNDAIDMFEEMRVVNSQQGLKFSDVFRMATIDGARALGMEQTMGSLEAGKRADFLVVQLRDPRKEPIEEMIRFAGARDVRATFVGGRETVVEDRELRAELAKVLAQIR
jgi:cytosine/adenosine deaminase-related metal-dependent hydrolase